MTQKKDQREPWICLALSLLLHLALLLGLSGVILEGHREPKGLDPLSIQVRLAEWVPPEPRPLQGVEEPKAQRALPARPMKGIVAEARPVLLVPASPARKRRGLPTPAVGSLSVPASPPPSAPAPPEPSPGEGSAAGRQVGEGTGGARPTGHREGETRESSPGPSPVAPTELAADLGKPEEGELPGKGMTAGAADGSGNSLSLIPAGTASGQGKQGGELSGSGTTAGTAGGSGGGSLARPHYPGERGGDGLGDTSGNGALSLAEPHYREKGRPIYPHLARMKGYEGTVLLEVEVGADGRVGDLVVKESSSYSILDEAALKAVRKWLFSPAKRGGTPVASRVLVPIQFKLVAGQEQSKE